jgi:ferredoxin
MPHVITEPCIGHKYATCMSHCPVDAIHEADNCPGSTELHGSNMLYIDPDCCIDCGMCTRVCPVNACFEEDEVPPEWDSFIDINADAFSV